MTSVEPVGRPLVCDDEEEAHRLAEAGAVVVLIAPASPGGLPAPVAGTGRIALLVGDPTNGADRAAAKAMSEELFGRSPTSGTSP